MVRATKKYESVRQAKPKAKVLRHFKIYPVLEMDATFHSSLDLGV